uniref:Uncharacterized protein n=1 Tax=Strongyloides papillosus TaxID=174720 RepID=A0A0N5C4G8_STREA
MKTIYLILTFAILYINAAKQRVLEPFYIQIQGYCDKDICVNECYGDSYAQCVENWTFLLIFKNGLCKCYPHPD